MRYLLPLIALLVLPAATPAGASPDADLPICLADPEPPKYYAIDLVSTRKISGARTATGTADVTFRRSPFGVSVSPTGTYTYDLHITVDRIRAREDGVYAVWVTTPNLDQVVRLGTLDEQFRATGTVAFNKFLVVISLEETDDPDQTRWQGPIVLRGMSRSGLMHTMAGHGPFQTEPCATYGFR